MEKNFDTISDLIKDPIFVQNVEKEISDLRTKRLNRPDPKPGYHYVRDWYDRMTENKQLNTAFFIGQIEAIWNKKSSLSSHIRSVIQNVCDVAVYKTHEHYAAIPNEKPKAKRAPRKKIAVVEQTEAKPS